MAFKLESNEYIILTARRHWFIPSIKTALAVFSTLIPIFLSSIIFSFPSLSEQVGSVGFLSMILLTSWIFLVWNTIFIIWTNHFLDVLVITNLHVFDIEQVGLWHREISTMQLARIQDISSKTQGIIQSLLDYGDLEVQTAGSLTNFHVKNIQRPNLIRQKINEQVNKVNLRF